MSEYEPEDSRNVTGTKSTPDGRWTNEAGKTPADKSVAKPKTAPRPADRKP